MSMIFSKVDSEQPEREFKVTLDVEDKTKKWMCECVITMKSLNVLISH